MEKMDLEIVKEFIKKSSKETKVYVGVDSERYKKNGKWYALYSRAVVVHKDGNKGAHVFGDTISLQDFDQRKDRPIHRLMQETYFCTELFLEIQEAIEDRIFEIHLDINPDEKTGSNCALIGAMGYVKGVTGITPKVKHESFAATFCADSIVRILGLSKVA